MSAPIRQSNEVNSLRLRGGAVTGPSAATTDEHERSPAALSRVPAVTDAPPTAPEPECSNVTAQRECPIEANLALENMRGSWLLNSEPDSHGRWLGRLSLAFSIIAAACGTVLFPLPNEVRNDAERIASVTSQLFANMIHAPRSAIPPRLVVQGQRAVVNEPVPLGISIVEGSGQETLTLLGLVTGTRLTVGTPLGLTGWQLSALDLGTALAYPPQDFVGTMDALIDLRSATNQPIDVQIVRFEWIQKTR
jgi:hypothetical protein